MKKETIIIEAKEVLKGKHRNGRTWHLAKIQDGETGRWFSTFEGKSVFGNLAFKEIHSGDLLEVEYEAKDNGKFQDLVLKSVTRPTFPNIEPSEEPKQPIPVVAPKPEVKQTLDDYVTDAHQAVGKLIDSLGSKDLITQETILKAIVQVAVEWMHVVERDRHGNL